MVRRRGTVPRDSEPEEIEVGLDELFWPRERADDRDLVTGEYDDDSDLGVGDDDGADEWDEGAPEEDVPELAGASFGVAFFGWLVASSTAVLFLALVAAVCTLIGWDRLAVWSDSGWFFVGVWTVLVLALGVGAFSGGYAGGRMVRSHGGRQGLEVWFFGWCAAAVLAGVGYLAERKHGLLASIDWPALPLAEPDRTRAVLIAAAAVLLVTLVGAVLGGASGNKS
jgi:hypothetical protein